MYPRNCLNIVCVYVSCQTRNRIEVYSRDWRTIKHDSSVIKNVSHDLSRITTVFLVSGFLRRLATVTHTGCSLEKRDPFHRLQCPCPFDFESALDNKRTYTLYRVLLVLISSVYQPQCVRNRFIQCVATSNMATTEINLWLFFLEPWSSLINATSKTLRCLRCGTTFVAILQDIRATHGSLAKQTYTTY